MPKLTRDQRDHLRDRLRSAERERVMPYSVEGNDPPEVKKARALIAKHEEQYRARRDKHNTAVRAASLEVEALILNSDFPSALAAVKKFEGGKRPT